MNIVIAANRLWKEELPSRLAERTGCSVHLIQSRKDLVFDSLRLLSPQYIFFPHWSEKIPADVHENFECVIFHMSDLPYGRGGTPLQNLISRGVSQTQVCALRCVNEIDAGPVYLRKPISLDGSAQEIYLKASDIIEGMIIEIIKKKPQPIPQIGDPVVFKRRKPSDGNLSNVTSLAQIYDYIRMLDAEGYPHAFLEIGKFRFEFRKAGYRGNEIVADVIIKELK